jgi:hypothetical protein
MLAVLLLVQAEANATPLAMAMRLSCFFITVKLVLQENADYKQY